MADPTDPEAVLELEQAAGCPLNPSVATPSAIDGTLGRILGPRPALHGTQTRLGAGARFDVEWDRSGATYLLFHLSQAVRAKATEIHFLPDGDTLAVFHRVAGDLVPVATEPQQMAFSLLARLEALGGPAIDDHVVHAEGQVACPMGEVEMSVDVSLLNVEGGVAVTLGLRSVQDQRLRLEDLGMAPVDVARLRELLERPAGLILVSGPVRSGCSTTLSCLLRAAATPTRRTILVETRPGPRHGVAARLTLDAVRARERWREIVIAQNADVICLGDVLSLNLRGIVSQRLIPRARGDGRVAAIEVMLNSPRIADLVAKGEIAALKTAIEANAQDGSRSFDLALYELYRAGEITLDEALRQADSANNLRVRIKMEEAGQSGDKPQFSLKQDPLEDF